jgi:hypothetical protein
MTNPPIELDPTDQNTARVKTDQITVMVKRGAIIGCYKYTVYFNDKVQQDPELEIVP